MMQNDALPEEWSVLRRWLPEDLNTLAFQCRFFQRARGLQDAELWLRLILMHVAGGLSLEQTVMRASELGLAQISGVALFKRLRRSEAWLRKLTQHLLREQRQWVGRNRWPWPQHLRVIDASDVQEPGATGTTWRLHYSLRLPEMTCDHYELTGVEGGEKLGRFVFNAGELVLVDRGYSHRAGVALVIEASAHVLVRWNPGVFPLEDSSGQPLSLLPELRPMQVNEVKEWPVWFTHLGHRYRLRLCARRKGRQAAERARRKAQRKAQKNGTQPDPIAMALTEFILVLTSLPVSQLPTAAALELYRCRWQVELAFKRLKSLLGLGHVPKNDDLSAKAWMQAKILTSLLVERVLLEGRFFSPWGYVAGRFESVAGVP
jgi:hypothetical protein